MKSSENVRGADNQQERLWYCGWVVGFVDGEGCFSCQIHRNGSMTRGWQVQPRFAVVQGVSSRTAIEDLAAFFGCGKIYTNRRNDNHREDLLVFQVQRYGDLRDIVLPFFRRHPLRTAKQDNFEKFAGVIDLMGQGRHLTVEGLIEIAEIAQSMNFRRPSKVLRILRDHTPTNS
jgi:hypothetical protein